MTDQAEQLRPYDLSSIDLRTLTAVVKKALYSEQSIITNWRHDRLSGGAGDFGLVVSAVYRFSGTAKTQAREADWSLILKVVGTIAADDDPMQSRYWKRELLAYQSGRLTKLPGGITSPRYFGSHMFSEKVIGLWLEDVEDESGSDWALKDYQTVARHLGQFNGAYLAEEELPSWSWLSHDWPRTLVEDYSTPGVERFRQTMDSPPTRQWFRAGDERRALELWEQRELYLKALDRLPQTLLHRDAFRRNLLVRHDGHGEREIVAVDWAYVGIGAVGEDLVSLVHASMVFSEWPISEADRLEVACIESYTEGLNEAGWHGDPHQVRLGYAAGSALIFGIGYAQLEPLGEESFPWIEQAYGRPIGEFMVLVGELRRIQLNLADEARALIEEYSNPE